MVTTNRNDAAATDRGPAAFWASRGGTDFDSDAARVIAYGGRLTRSFRSPSGMSVLEVVCLRERGKGGGGGGEGGAAKNGGCQEQS